MRIVVTSNGRDLASEASPVFGRCPVYVFVDSETLQFEAVDNPAISAAGGAGIQAAQFIVAQGAQAVVSGHVGPNAYQVLAAAGVPIYISAGGTVQDAVEAYKAGTLKSSGGATVGAHAGMGMGRSMGMGGGGRGMGRRASGMRSQPAALQSQRPQNQPARRDQELADLRKTAAELRKQLANVLDRLDRLDQGG
jgi:predicted Fe-Mo cluster-binding NifX family protein